MAGSRIRCTTVGWVCVVAAVCAQPVAFAQDSLASAAPLKTTYVHLSNRSNAIIVEPATPDAVRSRFALVAAHPEHLNMFDYFLGRELAGFGYRVMLVNYYGPEDTYEEFLEPLAAAITHLRRVPGVEKVVFAAHSTGGAELSFYQDVAENGPKACQTPEKVYPCRGDNLANLPKADGIMMLDINVGAPMRTIALDPAVDGRRPRERNPELDMYAPRHGFDPATGSASYDARFVERYFAAQAARNNQLIDEALGRLARIEKGDGDYKDDEPFVVAGASTRLNGARLDLADRRFLSRTRVPRLLLKADGSTVTQIVTGVAAPRVVLDDIGRMDATVQRTTVRHFLSFYALRPTADYALTETAITGIQWRSTPNSAPGNVEGVTVPTLVMVGTCYPHMVPGEITFDHSAAKDKAFVAVEGADHNLRPCRPEYGDTSRRAFDYVDRWLLQPGRF